MHPNTNCPHPMKHFRVITDFRGNHCLQARRPSFLFFLWKTHAISADRTQLQTVCDGLNADA